MVSKAVVRSRGMAGVRGKEMIIGNVDKSCFGVVLNGSDC